MESKDNLGKRLFFKLASDNPLWAGYLLPSRVGFNLDGSLNKNTPKRKPSK
jgi:hypothetical protein